MLGVKPIDGLMEFNLRWLADHGELLKDPSQYQRLIGEFIYLIITRPDISFVVGIMS